MKTIEELDKDLNKAADTYAYTIYPSEGVANIEVNNAFKAGAEWMARQGETLAGIITKVGDKLDIETTEYIIPEESEFERGEHVTVQIRKIELKENK